MQTMRLRHPIGVVTVVAGLTLSILLAMIAVNPWHASATNQSKATNAPSGASESIPVNPWAANGISPTTLEGEGWDCPFVVHAVHCLPPGGLEGISAGTAEAVTALVFAVPAEQQTVAPATFLGTEFNIRADLFHGQRCPTDPPSGEYTHFSEIGLPFDYYACHHFDSPL